MKIAVVSGANRGIGLGIAKGLSQADFKVLMVGRDQQKIKQAAADLTGQGLQVEPFVVDIAFDDQVKQLAQQLDSQYDHLDVLVNNAGVIIGSGDDGEPPAIRNVQPETVLQTININTVGALRMTQALMPLLERSSAPRIVNISSGMGSLNEMEGGHPAYRISKAGLNAVTRITAQETRHPTLKVNSLCPGWVRTDMGGMQASRSVEEAVPGILWAAQLPDDGPTGGFFRDTVEIAW